MARLQSLRERLRFSVQYREGWIFFRNNLYRLLLWPLLAAFTGLIGWSVLLIEIDEDRRQIESEALKDAQILARAYANHLFRALEAVDHITLHVKNGWEASNGQLTLENLELDRGLPASAGVFISIINDQGNSITSNIPQPRSINVSNAKFFTVHQENSSLFYIGTPQVGHLSGRPVVPFSRRLSDAEGNFDGIVLVSIAPENFISGYDEITLQNHGLLAILDKGNSVRLARIGKSVLLPEESLFTSLSSLEKQGGSIALEGNDYFPDKRTRYVGWQKTQAYDMTALAGIDQQEALAIYRSQRSTAIENAILLSFGLGLLALVATYFWIRLAWKKYQFDTMQKSYRAATEAANEGFYILTPVCKPDNSVYDFSIADCNVHGAEFLRYRRDELIGKTIRSIYQGKAATDTIRMLCRAMKDGFYENEADWRSLGIMEGPAWVHLKIARQDKNLAVTMRDISDTKSHVEELERRSNEDALTGLPNRHWVNINLPLILERSANDHSMAALLFIDLDGFKKVNDTKGHDAGDEILCAVARRLKEAVRPHDDITRLGGDEFLAILRNIHHDSEAAHVAERILEAFHPPFKITQGLHAIGTSIGISMFPQHGTTSNILLKNADMAMYAVKTDGKHGYRFFDQHYYQTMHERHQKEVDLKHALEQDQFVLYYQPRVDVHTGITSSMEALVRWAHPTKGLIEPQDFISLARETGLINKLGEKVIDKVCAQLAQWKTQEEKLVPVSINVDARQFYETNIVTTVSSCLARYNVSPTLLEIELTEATMLMPTEEVMQTLNTFQKMGVKLLVDDFGTGYSSLSQLQRLEFDVLKIDQSFTAQLNRSKEGIILFKAIVTMAHSLGMKVVAEGVETIEQVKTLKALQCDEIQGFYISKPLPASDSQPFIPQWRLLANI